MIENNEVIGIVTIDNFTNYGNRLQNFALTRLLENQGKEIVNGVRVFTKDDWVNRTNGIVKKNLKKIVPYFLIKNKIYYESKPINGLLGLRQKRFNIFSNKYTTRIPPIVCRSHKQAYIRLKKKGINYLITGSDQVWNPYYEAKEYQFLTFAPKNKRLSFAASIGVENIPKNLEKIYKKNLKDMRYISVREEKAAQIIENLTGIKATITLDPTLLLEKEEWKHIVKKPPIDLNEKYICTYFLGEIPKAVSLFAKKVGLKICALNSEDNPDLYTIDPAEFLYMIENAEYVLTDSFHAVAFSIKFNKEFYVFRRAQIGVNDMFSRIETITQRFGLENRIQNREEIVEQDLISNWENIESVLMEEKSKSINELMKIMES